MRTYTGVFKYRSVKIEHDLGGEAYAHDDLLPGPSQKLVNHSPDGFDWGYSGSGPAQLALALLLDVTGDSSLALRHYQNFKFDVVAKLDFDWELTDNQINDWIKEKTDEMD